MTVAEAREILRRTRPDTADSTEPEVVAALELTRQDADLSRWWEEEQAWRRLMMTALRGFEPPGPLRNQLAALVSRRRVEWWRRPAGALALAAGIALLIGVAGWLWQPKASGASYEVWRQRMARTALREYRMDLVTNNLAAVQVYLAQTNPHEHLPVPAAVRALPVVGGTAVRFQNQPVSMLCFDRGGGQLLWLFVVDRAALVDPPGERRFEMLGELATVTWSADDQVVLMAVLGDEPLLRGFL